MRLNSDFLNNNIFSCFNFSRFSEETVITTPLWKTPLTLHSVRGLSVCTPAPGWITYHWGSSSTEHPHVRILYISRYITEVEQEYCGRDDNPTASRPQCYARFLFAGTFGSRPRPNNRDLTKLRRRRQGERQKSDKKTTAHVHHAFLYISLLSLHNYDVKWPNFKFTWERERQGDEFYHLCQNTGAVPSLQLQPKFPSFK